jgi:hypothetical protein
MNTLSVERRRRLEAFVRRLGGDAGMLPYLNDVQLKALARILVSLCKNESGVL